MGLFNLFKTPKENKGSDKLLTDAQIRAKASIGFNSDWLTGIGNQNLFNMAFEWIENGPYSKIMRFKSLKSDRINYAPTIRLYSDTNTFFYNGNSLSNQVVVKCFSLGNVIIPYPGKCFVKVIAPYVIFDTTTPNKEGPQVDDYSDILVIDYSPDTISEEENKYKRLLLREKETREREEIEEIKSQIKERNRRRLLEKQALQELIEEGEVFPDYNKRPPIPKDVADAVWNRDGGKCVYCGSTENLHFDHIIPFSKGGDTSVENLQLLCRKCNLEKSNKIG